MAEFHLTGKFWVPVATLGFGPWILENPSIFEEWDAFPDDDKVRLEAPSKLAVKNDLKI